jgi:DNA repair protein RadC
LSELLSADPIVVTDYSGETVARALAGARDLMTGVLEERLRKRQPVRSTNDATELLKHLIGLRSDEFLVVLFLDSARGFIDHEVVAVGRVNAVDLDSRRILFRAIGRGAAGIIVAHNHPSGDPRPSSSDVRSTRMLADAARAFEITLHDHLIVARDGVFSLREAGMI